MLMNLELWYPWLLYAFVFSALFFFVLLFFIPAPYGRYTKGGWGPRLNSHLGWMLMESPSLWLFLLFYLTASQHETAGTVLLVLWLLHYGQRVLVFPWLIREDKGMPLVVAASAFIFQLANVTLQAGWLYHLAPQGRYTGAWLLDIRFISGAVLFAAGYGINRWADSVLRGLRRQDVQTYVIPQGGLYRWISCPNYLGEIMLWGGWALMTWCPAGLAFWLWTIANLLPRAWRHHRWYRETFADYPAHRRALIPGLF